MNKKQQRKTTQSKVPKQIRNRRGESISAARNYTWGLFSAARKGDRDAAKDLMLLARNSTELMQDLYDVQPELVKGIVKGQTEFPVMQSWSNAANEKRARMVQDLGLGSRLPLKADANRDSFYRRIVEDYFPGMALDAKTAELPLPSEDPRWHRKWATGIVDDRYPKHGKFKIPSDLDPSEWAVAKKQAKNSRKSRANRRSKRVNSSETFFGELYRKSKRESAELISLGDFRSALIDAIASRLKHGCNEDTEANLAEFRRRSAEIQKR